MLESEVRGTYKTRAKVRICPVQFLNSRICASIFGDFLPFMKDFEVNGNFDLCSSSAFVLLWGRCIYLPLVLS